MNDDLAVNKGVQYIRESSFNRASLSRFKRPAVDPVPPFKHYPDADKTKLPRTAWQLDEARIIPLLQQRRSLRSFKAEPLELGELAFLMWSMQGISAQIGDHFLRTAPSAGALYPIETYVCVHHVATLSSGIFHFDVQNFLLELIVPDYDKTALSHAFLDQQFLEQSAVTFIWTAIARRSIGKYGDRAGRYLFFDAAHICQNVLLGAEAIGCGGCPVAAFYDDEVEELLGLSGQDEVPLYAAAVGKK